MKYVQSCRPLIIFVGRSGKGLFEIRLGEGAGGSAPVAEAEGEVLKMKTAVV